LRVGRYYFIEKLLGIRQKSIVRIALAHDYLIRMGGAERVLFQLHKLFPEAPIYTLLYDKEEMGGYFKNADIRVSFLQKFPRFFKNDQKHLLPFSPIAVETFDLRDFDLIISSSSAFAKAIITRPGTVHVCYCHSPAGFLWDGGYLNQLRLGFIRRCLAGFLIHYLRIWDKSSSKRVDYFIANSKSTREKIKKYYRGEATVVYPPAPLADMNEFFESYRNQIFAGPRREYFLIVSEPALDQKIDLAVEAFNKLKLPLVIMGSGSDFEKISRLAEPNIRFLGWQREEIKKKYLKNCTAFICPGQNDFGMAAVEAMSYGKPILAFRGGLAGETVLEGVTGEFFDEPVAEILADGVRRLRENLSNFSPLVIRKWAEKFSEEKFRREIMDFVKKVEYNKF
jgi:glycosyltransferase involved in cell wall biosynthesis